MRRTFDCIVLGVGGVGSAALYHLARRGARVLGLDRFTPGHDRGSSHGETRVIRLAYFEHPDYVPLLHRAYTLWEELASQRDETLYVQTGILEIGPRDGEVVPGVTKAARQHGLDVEELSAVDIRQGYPGIQLPEDWAGIFESRGGYLRVEACVRAHADEAVQHGAHLRTGEVIEGWDIDGDSVVVHTHQETYRAQQLIVTAGAWAPQLLESLGVHLTVLRKPLLWYRTQTPNYHVDNGFPVWLFETSSGTFYGFPEIDTIGIKVAEHSHGSPVDDPLALDSRLLPEDRQPVESFLAAHLPEVSRECLYHTVCMYTMTPDQHFLIDRHPQHAQVCFAAGLSGHGFKFATVLGEILAQLTWDGETPQPIGFLGLDRFLTTPEVPPAHPG
jgi:sarcosine oxidase